MIIQCCEVSDIAARPPHAVKLAKEDVLHSAFGIIRTAVKMRVDRGIRFLGREEIEHLDFPSWISSRVQRKLGICSARGEAKVRATGAQRGPPREASAREGPGRGPGGSPVRNQPAQPAQPPSTSMGHSSRLLNITNITSAVT